MDGSAVPPLRNTPCHGMTIREIIHVISEVFFFFRPHPLSSKPDLCTGRKINRILQLTSHMPQKTCLSTAALQACDLVAFLNMAAQILWQRNCFLSFLQDADFLTLDQSVKAKRRTLGPNPCQQIPSSQEHPASNGFTSVGIWAC